MHPANFGGTAISNHPKLLPPRAASQAFARTASRSPTVQPPRCASVDSGKCCHFFSRKLGSPAPRRPHPFAGEHRRPQDPASEAHSALNCSLALIHARQSSNFPAPYRNDFSFERASARTFRDKISIILMSGAKAPEFFTTLKFRSTPTDFSHQGNPITHLRDISTGQSMERLGHWLAT